MLTKTHICRRLYAVDVLLCFMHIAYYSILSKRIIEILKLHFAIDISEKSWYNYSIINCENTENDAVFSFARKACVMKENNKDYSIRRDHCVYYRSKGI